jgi:membrane dipeptidase
MTGGLWCITTNPFRRSATRKRLFVENLARLRRIIAAQPSAVRVVRTASEYAAAKHDGVHAAFMCVQGANCLGPDDTFEAVDPDDVVIAATIVHLTSSEFAETSTPLPAKLARTRGLTERGRALIHGLNQKRAFVDLAHIGAKAFWDTVATHDKAQPLIDTHTGVRGVADHWRNLDDAQLKAIADTGGVVGIIFERAYLRRPGGPDDVEMIVEHMDHAVKVMGEDHVSLGTDYDGAISPPKGLEDGASLPRLVEAMLKRGWTEQRVKKILGENFLRAFRSLRP